jgi:hypothetical protein
MVDMLSELPVEVKSKVFTFMSHPCADMVGKYHKTARTCARVACHLERRLPHELTVPVDFEAKGQHEYKFSLNVCRRCVGIFKREYKELKRNLRDFSETCQEREIRTWFYENYRLPRNTLELFESMFEDDVDSDFEEEEEN